VAARAVDTLCRVTGRRPVVRTARFALHRARWDIPNDPRTNGEYQLQRWLLAAVPATELLTVLDVGANVGRWSGALLAQIRRSAPARPVRLHAFEPAPQAYRRLAAHLPPDAVVNQLAVSGTAGEATLHLVGPAAGINSLHAPAGTAKPVWTEQVKVITIDEYLRAHRISGVHLLKVDTEGHDFEVLHGARRSFAAQAIAAAQFEYNHRWVHSRHYLKDVFDLLGPLGYRIGKLTPRGIETYPGWDPELETFVEGNYLACTAEMARRLPAISWWKHPG
jgi:FkbM family methyltransferase